ncbi:hypothetical protein [Pseudomonas prosekii]|uniref:Uncharacterized protein n=1 Tax=Pseudomonas prosekii TaxID=1148509 RepID=A0A1H2A6K1_9PSED|nr:hypothetical protein [Pseudomonas prosekii]SDT41608.1 hypothetical protein SAMN05216222_4291 [Pseudomonas prosekii]
MKDKYCDYCGKVINRGSPQYYRKKYCCESHKQMHNRRKKNIGTRQTKRLSNLPVNKEWLYIARECKRAGTVQIMSMHTVDSLRELIQLICSHPKGNMEINHVYPVNGYDRIGLLHPLNLFYGGSAQNRKFGKKSFEGAGYSISRTELNDKWSISKETSDKNTLKLLMKFLGGVLLEYVKTYPVNQYGKIKIIDSIIKLDKTGKYTRENLISMPSFGLSSIKAELHGVKLNGFYLPPRKNRSKVLIYLEELSRISRDASGSWAENCEYMKSVFLAGAAALLNAGYQPELSEIYKTYGRDAIRHENRFMRKAGKAKYSSFKDFLYLQTADCLVGKKIDKKMLSSVVDKYTETRKGDYTFRISSIDLTGCSEYHPDAFEEHMMYMS